jgi:Spy/CpxP family protein refolding chaperone
MKTLRLIVIAAAASLGAAAAIAQPATQSTPQIEQSSSGGCGWKSTPAATS